jgi:hypothetical protein
MERLYLKSSPNVIQKFTHEEEKISPNVCLAGSKMDGTETANALI